MTIPWIPIHKEFSRKKLQNSKMSFQNFGCYQKVADEPQITFEY